jgi:hypothetical protein
VRRHDQAGQDREEQIQQKAQGNHLPSARFQTRAAAGSQEPQLMQIEAERAAESSLKSSKVICFTSFAEREFEDSVLAGADRNHRDQR